MHRGFAAWLTEHPWRPLIAVAFCGALSQLMLPFTVLACAIPVLTVLRFDARLGAIAAAIGAATASAIVSALAPTVPVGTFPAIALSFFAPLALALVLKRTGSLNLCFQLAVLATGVLLVIVHVALADPVGAWKPLLTQFLDAMQATQLTPAERDAWVTALARSMWGLLGAFALATVFGALLLGRWWESLLRPEPGTFGAEYRMLRLGIALGLVTTVLFVLAVTLDVPLIGSLAWVGFMALTFQGLAAAHRRRLNRGWLAAIYVLLIVPLSNLITMFVLASWGFADNWARPRRPASL